MQRRILILADDLSGAADCAVACARAGLGAHVCFDVVCAAEIRSEALAIDLDTRQRTPGEAREATLAAAGLIGGRVLYRKIDSTLRGHVGVELAATLEIAGPGAFAVVCPAYPTMGRMVQDGQVLVRGAPLRETEIWRHEGRGDADLTAMLTGAGLTVVPVPLAAVRGGAEALGARLAEAVAGGADVLLCDAESDADLGALVTASLPMPGAVWAGSGGMAIPLAAALSPRGAGVDKPAPTRGAGPLLVVVGSASSVSRRQLEELRRDPGTILIRISPSILLDGPGAPGWRPAVRSLVAAIGRPGKDVVVAAIDPDAAVDLANGPRLAAALGQLIGPQLSRFSALVATGGETARNLLEAIGVRSLLVERELEPGIPMSSLEGGLPVVTKAGAFGNPGSLVRCVQALRALPLAPVRVSGASVRP